MSRNKLDELYTQAQYRLIEQLGESEKRYRELVENLKNVVFGCDETGALTFLNRAWEETTGFRVQDSLGRGLCEFVHREDRAAVQAALSGPEGSRPIEVRIPDCRGAPLWFELTVRSDQRRRSTGFLYQVTERKKFEDALSTERRRLAFILEGTHAGTWEWNVQTGETVFNERWAEIIGYTLEEISPVSIETWERFAHPDDFKRSSEPLQKHFRGELDYYECEARMRHKEGHWVWVVDRGRVSLRTPDGSPLLVSGTHTEHHCEKTSRRGGIPGSREPQNHTGRESFRRCRRRVGPKNPLGKQTRGLAGRLRGRGGHVRVFLRLFSLCPGTAGLPVRGSGTRARGLAD